LPVINLDQKRLELLAICYPEELLESLLEICGVVLEKLFSVNVGFYLRW